MADRDDDNRNKMQIATEITFEGSEPSPAAREAILKEIERLETHNQRITGCRVSVIAPSHKHRHGTGFQIHIWLTLPPHEISSSTSRILTTRGTNTLKSRSGTLSRSPGVRLTPLQSEANSQARMGRAFGRSDLQRVLQKQRPQRGAAGAIKAIFQDQLTFKTTPELYLGFKLFRYGGHEVIFNGLGQIIFDHFSHRKDIGVKLLRSADVAKKDRVPMRADLVRRK
jgi:hypothetical protein